MAALPCAERPLIWCQRLSSSHERPFISWRWRYTDSTRVVSYSVAPEGSNRPFPTLGIAAEGYHFLTHHMGNQEKILKVAKIERWYMERFARFLSTLDSMKDADVTSVLENSMVVYGIIIILALLQL